MASPRNFSSCCVSVFEMIGPPFRIKAYVDSHFLESEFVIFGVDSDLVTIGEFTG